MAKRAPPRNGTPNQIRHGVARLQREEYEMKWDKVVEDASDELSKLFSHIPKLTDPKAQVMAFFSAIADGMPPREAAGYFLHIDSDEEWAAFESNEQAAMLVRDFTGRLMQSQYRKVMNGTSKEALEVLRVIYPDKWRERKELTISGKTDAQVREFAAFCSAQGMNREATNQAMKLFMGE